MPVYKINNENINLDSFTYIVHIQILLYPGVSILYFIYFYYKDAFIANITCRGVKNVILKPFLNLDPSVFCRDSLKARPRRWDRDWHFL